MNPTPPFRYEAFYIGYIPEDGGWTDEVKDFVPARNPEVLEDWKPGVISRVGFAAKVVQINKGAPNGTIPRSVAYFYDYGEAQAYAEFLNNDQIFLEEHNKYVKSVAPLAEHALAYWRSRGLPMNLLLDLLPEFCSHDEECLGDRLMDFVRYHADLNDSK